MIHDVPKPEISPDFTIDDIHKIREWNYERYKGMTRAEILADTQRGAAAFEALIEAARAELTKSTD
jgi:hypothetical protein